MPFWMSDEGSGEQPVSTSVVPNSIGRIPFNSHKSVITAWLETPLFSALGFQANTLSLS